MATDLPLQKAHSQIKHITLLTEPSLQSTLLKESLERNLTVSVDIFSITTLTEQVPPKSDYVMIDLSFMVQDRVSDYVDYRIAHFPNAQEILINCPRKWHDSELFKWAHLVGIFYIDDDVARLTQGIEKIIHGELWLSRKLAQAYILYFRRIQKSYSSKIENKIKLTRRELEIIKLLGRGASNLQIAKKLAVSENTVKTHLHNTFKKIRAKNRLQALIWAREHQLLDDDSALSGAY